MYIFKLFIIAVRKRCFIPFWMLVGLKLYIVLYKEMNVVLQLFIFDFDKCNNYIEKAYKELRLFEYTTVLLKNLEDPYIKKLHILYESQAAADYYQNIAKNYLDKIEFKVIGHQPTYKEIIDYVISRFTEKEIVCIMNADIFFNSEKDHLLIQKHLSTDSLFALTRHEITDEGHTIHSLETCPFTTDSGGSSDTFIFYSPIKSNFDTSTLNYHQNMFGAENVFMKAWTDAGYKVYNPCDDIITLHMHKNRVHFKQYQNIYNPETSIMNVKGPLPPIN